MMTDWLIVRRLGAELDRAARGARIKAAGLLADGRFALRLPRAMLAIDAFGAVPIVTYEDGDAQLRDEAGWVRAFAKTVSGMKIEAIRARRGDRLIALDVAAQSRFGVATTYRIVCELVPRFGNLVLLKEQTVVSAAREFRRGDRASRTVAAGDEYEPPPLPAALDEGERAAKLAAVAAALAGRESIVKPLRACVPLLPQLVAQSFAAEFGALAVESTNAESLAARAIAKAEALIGTAGGESAGLGDVFVYREAGAVVQFHVVPLRQFADRSEAREPALLPLCTAVTRSARVWAGDRSRADRLRALRARAAKRTSALEDERRSLERERDDELSRDRLRRSGETLYAHAVDVPPRATSYIAPHDPDLIITLDPELDAKGNAAAYFKRYRKAATKVTHLERRLNEIERELAFGAELGWMLEDDTNAPLGDLTEALERFEHKRASRDAKPRRGNERPRPPETVTLGADARLYVGRSPRENADVTFRLGRPGDLWFHARGIPGAHVILHLDVAREPSPQEIEAAASYAAAGSRARDNERVEVDYTERKYVRKQQGGAPGLVWYTGARTVSVRPAAREREPAPIASSSA